jgi:hypothetical protein
MKGNEKSSLRNLKVTVEEKHNMISGSRFNWATSIGAHSRKLKSFKLSDFTAGVAPN